MAFYSNFEGTLKNLISLGKQTNKVSIQSNSGKLRGKSYNGNYAHLGHDVVTNGSSFAAVDGQIHLVTASVTATLPAPTVNAKIVIKNTGAFTITVAPNGAEEIEGVAGNYTLNSELEAATFVSDGTDWFRI